MNLLSNGFLHFNVFGRMTLLVFFFLGIKGCQILQSFKYVIKYYECGSPKRPHYNKVLEYAKWILNSGCRPGAINK